MLQENEGECNKLSCKKDVNSLQELSDFIADHVFFINSNVKNLKDFLKHIGTDRDNIGLRNKISTIQDNTNKLANLTSKDITKLKSNVAKSDKQLRLQVENLEENFIETLKRYHSIQQKLKEKQKKHILLVANTDVPDEDDDDVVNYASQRQSQILLDLQIEQERLLGKEHMVTNVQAEILDINHIMKDLGSMIQHQAAPINKVEDNINEVAIHVEAAAEDLERTLVTTTKHRKRWFIIIIILCAIIMAVLGCVIYFLLRK